jgi:hypothetical protein
MGDKANGTKSGASFLSFAQSPSRPVALSLSLYGYTRSITASFKFASFRT